jgi:hypothetical protein
MEDFQSKYSGEQVEAILDAVANGEAGGGGGGITVETDPIFSASPAASITEAKKAEWDNKVDKVSGKQLSTQDFTTELEGKLKGIEANAQKNVQSDWNENDRVSDAYVNNRTHYSYDIEPVASFSVASKNEGDILVTGLSEGAFYKFYGSKSDTFYFVVGRKVIIPAYGPTIEAVCAYEDDYCLKLTTPTYGLTESFSLMKIHVEQLDDVYIPETIARKTEIATINGQSLTEGGDITIQGGGGSGNVYKWVWNTEASGTFTEEEFENLNNADVVYITASVAGMEVLYSVEGKIVVEDALHLGAHILSFETDTDNNKVAYVEGISFIFDNASKTWSMKGGNAELITNEQLTAALEGKQDTIEDLEDIKEGASKGATALQGTETSEELDDVETNTFVKYVVQTLTETQKQQARNNIGAASTEYVLSLFNELKEMILSGGGGGVVIPSAILDSAILNNSKLV